MKHLRTGLFLAIVIAALAWGACGRGSTTETRTINVSVLNQALYGSSGDKLIRVKQGERVAMRITADEPMEIFLHTYDIEVSVTPGSAGTLQFTANTLGRFPLMIHALGDEGGSHQRAEILLGFVEVLSAK